MVATSSLDNLSLLMEDPWGLWAVAIAGGIGLSDWLGAPERRRSHPARSIKC